ncbi:MAG: hypothetical protein KF782_21465 [Labilithrix sp.]|nr:hypothetical protein [Labilithrix sp.]
MLPRAHACPCCGRLTLEARAGFEICPVCFWEDDGQDDVDAHLDRGGPNRGSLWQARANYLRFGACEEVAKQHVRGPLLDEPEARQWSLLDDVAVERIPSSNVSAWNLLHDGTVAGIERSSDGRVSVIVDIPYLRTRFAVPGTAFRLELFDCSRLEFTPYDRAATSSLDEIAQAEADILEARNEESSVVVWGSTGVLKVRYQDLSLRFDDGAPLAHAALEECARTYWDEWARGAARLQHGKKKEEDAP